MSKLLAVRAAQEVLSASFTFNHTDWVVDTVAGTKKTLGSTVALSADPLETDLTGAVAATITFDAMTLPVGAVVVGGEVIVETAYATSTAATIKVGIPGTLEAFLAASSGDLKSTAGTRIPLVLTSALAAVAGSAVRLTIAYTVANATAGKVRVRIEYVVDGKATVVSL